MNIGSYPIISHINPTFSPTYGGFVMGWRSQSQYPGTSCSIEVKHMVCHTMDTLHQFQNCCEKTGNQSLLFML